MDCYRGCLSLYAHPTSSRQVTWLWHTILVGPFACPLGRSHTRNMVGARSGVNNKGSFTAEVIVEVKYGQSCPHIYSSLTHIVAVLSYFHSGVSNDFAFWSAFDKLIGNCSIAWSASHPSQYETSLWILDRSGWLDRSLIWTAAADDHMRLSRWQRLALAQRRRVVPTRQTRSLVSAPDAAAVSQAAVSRCPAAALCIIRAVRPP